MIKLENDVVSRIERASVGKSILVALSGGGDSTALLHLMSEAFGLERLRVCVIDHALRAGSADDAALACGRARMLGVEAEIKTLAWLNGPKTSQAAARTARYRALCEAARAYGAALIALGHNADDQAETIVMRSESGSSWRGLAGMREIAPAPIWPEGRGLWLARPLLGHRRADLRNLLREKHAAWIEDPANSNPDYTRVRMRARLAEMEQNGFEPLQLCAEARTYQARAAALDRAARALIANACSVEEGAATIDPKVWGAAAEDVRSRALSVLLAAIAGAGREASGEAVARLAQEMHASGFAGASLGGALVKLWKASFRMARDPGAVLGRADGAMPLPGLELVPGIVSVWDNRLEINVSTPGWRVMADSSAAPAFEKHGVNLSRAEAELTGEIRASWLTQAQIAHLLPPEGDPFTPS